MAPLKIIQVQPSWQYETELYSELNDLNFVSH